MQEFKTGDFVKYESRSGKVIHGVLQNHHKHANTWSVGGKVSYGLRHISPKELTHSTQEERDIHIKEQHELILEEISHLKDITMNLEGMVFFGSSMYLEAKDIQLLARKVSKYKTRVLDLFNQGV